MKKLIKRVALWGFGLFLIASVVDYIFSRIAIKTISTDSHVWDEIYNHKITDPCLIYGSSRASVHIDPKLIEQKTGISVYNFGMPGQTFYLQNFRHKENVKVNGFPRYIILSMDVFTFVPPGDYISNGYQFLPYMLWNLSYYKNLNRFFHSYEFVIPLVRYYGKDFITNGVLKYIITQKSYKYLSKGYNPVDKLWDDEIDISDQEKISRVEVKSTQIENFCSFIEECEDNDARLALVYTPEYYLVDMYVSNKDSILTLYDSIAKAHNLVFLDYSKDSITRDTSYFYNTMHMNRKGSKLITEKIITDLKNTGFFEK